MIDGLNKLWNKFLNLLEEKNYKSYEEIIISLVCSDLNEKFLLRRTYIKNENTWGS